MTGEGIGTEDWRVRNIEEQAQNLDKLIVFLDGRVNDPKLGTDFWLVMCLVKSAKLAYKHIRSGWQTDSSHVAWACRNLLELRIFGKYAAHSAENRKRFIADMTVDSVQSNEAVIKMIELNKPGSPTAKEEIAELIRISDALRQTSGFEGRSYLLSTILAKELGLIDELSIYKLCSKLIHPTAQSIFLVASQNQNERDALFLSGGRYLLDLMDDLVSLTEQLQVENANRLGV
jgi:hypothetical protein